MQTLLIIALIIAGLYFFYSKEKQQENKPTFSPNQSTELESSLDKLIAEIQHLNQII